MTNHAESIVRDDRFDGARAAIADAKARALRALIAGDEDLATRLERQCLALCNHTFARGMGENAFSAASAAVEAGVRGGRAALTRDEERALASIETEALRVAFAPRAPGSAEIIPFPRR